MIGSFGLKLLLGVAVGVGIAYLAHRAHALNKSGGVAAGVLGAIVFGLGGVGWAILMLTFFISSSGLSRLFRKRKAHLEANFSKGTQRDAYQVLANGGMAGLLALIYFFLSLANPASQDLSLLWVGFAACLAGANADTWGTELGVLNPRQPVLLTTFHRVPRGTSGGVSLAGSLAALAGSALIGGVASLISLAGWAPGIGIPMGLFFIGVSLAGLAGAFVDSILGATLQASYYCPICEKETEQHPWHVCGTKTTHQRGLIGLNNDWVNAACTISAGLVGILLFLALS